MALNASEEFRANMSKMKHEEMSDAAVAGFLKKAEERRIPIPDEEKAEAVEEPAAEVEPEPEVERVVETEAEPAPAPEPEAEPAEDEDPEIDLGDGQTMRFSDLVKSGMRQADYTRKTQELAEQRREFDRQRDVANQQLAEASARTQELAGRLTAQLSDPSKTAELEHLRQTDPGEYAARVSDLQRQQAMVHAAAVEQDRILQTQLAAEVPRQRYLLGQSLSEFDGASFDAAYKTTGEYALGAGGLRPEEWSQLVDHRHVILVEKARRYDELTSKTPTLPKKLAKIPRSIRPGAASEPKPKGHAAEQDYQAALAKQEKEGGSLKSTANAFLAREKMRRAR